MNAGRRQEIEQVAQQLLVRGEFVPAAMLRELLAEVERLRAELDAVPREAIRKIVRRNDIRIAPNGFSPLAELYDPVWEWLEK